MHNSILSRGGEVIFGPSSMPEPSFRKSIMDYWLLCGCTGKNIKLFLPVEIVYVFKNSVQS